MTDKRYLGGGECLLNNNFVKVTNNFLTFVGAAIKMDHFQPAVDPRKQELLEARFLGARVNSQPTSLLFELFTRQRLEKKN